MTAQQTEDTAFPEEILREDEKIFTEATDRVLASPEVVGQLGSDSQAAAGMREYLSAKRETLIGVAATERQQWADAAAGLEQSKHGFSRAERKGKESWLLWILTPAFALWIVAFAVGIVQLVVGYLFAQEHHSLAGWRLYGFISLGVGVVAFIIFMTSNEFDDKLTDSRLKRNFLQTAPEARRKYTDALVQRMLGEARDEINRSLQGDIYGLELKIRDAPGLAEVYSDEYWVPSKASTRLSDLVKQMPGGTIGLAGPRGVGKTSLIRQYCPEEIYVRKSPRDLALQVSAPVEYAPKEFVLYLLATLCRGYLRYRKTDDKSDGFSPVPRLPMSPRLRAAILESWRYDGADLAGRATQYLREARYLQTITTSVGASLSVPGQIAGISGQSAAAAAEVPRSYPELVSEFTWFLRSVAYEVNEAGGRLFIGVDELDKIGDAAQAQRFVNELKVVLGVPNCYYFISVSDDALAAYEMRGLPVRDAFDSAFDEVLHLDYLRLDDSSRLLSKRVIGMSLPFVCLCHCLSGGLPRDLIRTARRVVAVGQDLESVPGDLAAVCRRLTLDELSRKLHAAGVRLAGRTVLREESELLHDLQRLVAIQPDGRVLLDGLRQIAAVQPGTAGKSGSWMELTAYAHYLLALTEVFGQDLTPEQIEYGIKGWPASEGAFDQLCFARQTLGTDPGWAWLTIEEFRAAWGHTPEYQYPSPTPQIGSSAGS